MKSGNVTEVSHQQLVLKSSYEDFIDRLENTTLKSLESNWAELLGRDMTAFQQHIRELEGSTGLMIFKIQAHGDLLAVMGKPRKAKQYVIGNPLTATRMTQLDIRAALYAPLRMLVYEGDSGETCVFYDLPSSLFGQFGNDAILEVAKELDDKLVNAIRLADTAN
jgi:uncharacterized protein (DUF302 family)